MGILGGRTIIDAFRSMRPAFLSEGLVSSEDELIEIIGIVEREWDND